MKQIAHFRYTLLAAAVVLLLPLLLPSGTLATEVLVFALAALGCNLLLGYTGLMSFGQGIFFGVGSYTTGVVLLQFKLALLPALALAAWAGRWWRCWWAGSRSASAAPTS
jgi:branched-chain amino acid transport system permease protein